MRMLGMCLLLVCVSAASADQLYKWVDEQGHVHYSQTPPPSAGTKAKSVELQGVQTVPLDVDQDAVAQQQARQQQAKQDQRKAEVDAQKQAVKQRYCDDLRARLQLYQQSGPVFIVDAQGERHYVSDADHEKTIQDLQDQIAKDCSGTP